MVQRRCPVVRRAAVPRARHGVRRRWRLLRADERPRGPRRRIDFFEACLLPTHRPSPLRSRHCHRRRPGRGAALGPRQAAARHQAARERRHQRAPHAAHVGLRRRDHARALRSDTVVRLRAGDRAPPRLRISNDHHWPGRSVETRAHGRLQSLHRPHRHHPGTLSPAVPAVLGVPVVPTRSPLSFFHSLPSGSLGTQVVRCSTCRVGSSGSTR